MSVIPLVYPFPDVPCAPALCEVAPGVSWLRLDLPWGLNHINLWLLDDGDGVCVVDTGLGDPASRAAWSALLDKLGRPLTRIIVTHFHPDHLGNADWLARSCGVPVWLALGEFLLAHAVHGQIAGYDVTSMLQHFRCHGLDEERLARMESRGNIYRRGVPTLPARIERLLDGETLHIGGRDWQPIVGYGHSPEHIALYCAEADILISGDMLLPRVSTNVSTPAAMPAEDSVGRFLTSLRRFEPLPAKTLVLPAHGLPFRGLHARIGQLFAHHAERNATMLEALTTPKNAAELLPVLFPRDLDPHQLMFAMGEAIAHLNHLWRLGCVQRIEDSQGHVRFQV